MTLGKQGTLPRDEKGKGTYPTGEPHLKIYSFNMRMAKNTKQDSANKIRVRLKAFDHRILDEAVRKIMQSVLASGADLIGPIPMPTQKKRFTVLRSPHTDKDSREHFEMRTHIRVLDILNPSNKTIDSLMHLELPAGVGIQIKN